MILSMILWGLSWPSAKALTNYSSAVNLTFYRYVVVIFTLLPMLLFMKIPVKISKKGIPFVLISGVLLGVYSVFMFKGLEKGFAGAGGVLVTTLNPIMAYFISLIIRLQKPTRNEAVGLIFGLLAGCSLLKIWENMDVLFQSGNLFFLGSAFIWAVMSRFTAKSSTYGSPFAFSLWMYIVNLIILFPLLDFPLLMSNLHLKSMVFWGNVIFGGAIVTSIATTIYFYATSKLGSDKASSFIFLVPFAAAVSSWILLNEKLELHTIVGGVLGISAVYMIQRKTKKIE